MTETRAYAKLVGKNWEYYMAKPMITLGRGGKGVDCDVVLSEASVVSRQHFTIRYVPELQAFEVKTLSKNGILVNGDFLHKLSPPKLLRSHAEITYGRDDSMSLSFILPPGDKLSLKKKKNRNVSQVPMLQWIGEALLNGDPLNARQIRARIETTHPNQLNKLGSESTITSSIRHVLTQNDHIFFAQDPSSIGTKTSHRGDASAYENERNDACFSVYDAQKSRFFLEPTANGNDGKPNKKTGTA
ncbi:hypothetical protein FGB62_89g06 [Gracilaria domingensis]|nr:hypothetical protein FGB62_89g06 [Gracilaria domingensis]